VHLKLESFLNWKLCGIADCSKSARESSLHVNAMRSDCEGKLTFRQFSTNVLRKLVLFFSLRVSDK
jgi:hypothetical protein